MIHMSDPPIPVDYPVESIAYSNTAIMMEVYPANYISYNGVSH